MLSIPSGYKGENMAHFLKVLKFAEEVGAIGELLKQLDRLATYACHDDEEHTLCVLYADRPYSFSFGMFIKADDFLKDRMWPTERQFREWCEEKKIMNYRWHEGVPYVFWFNGGLIYSGPGHPLDGSGPAFTVSLDEEVAAGKRHTWSVHT